MLALKIDLKEFLQLFFVNRAKTILKTVNVTTLPKTDSSPERAADGSPIIYVVEPSDDERHIALGKFMDAWSVLENNIATMLSDAIGIHVRNIPTLMNALGTRGELDVISVLGPIGLKPAQRADLTSLLDRIKENNTKRNRIVHGYWLLEVWLYDWNGALGIRRYQYRMYEPSDPDVRRSLTDPKNRTARRSYMFSLPRMRGITKEVLRLAGDVAKFNGARQNLPVGARRYLVEGHLVESQFQGQ